MVARDDKEKEEVVVEGERFSERVERDNKPTDDSEQSNLDEGGNRNRDVPEPEATEPTTNDAPGDFTDESGQSTDAERGDTGGPRPEFQNTIHPNAPASNAPTVRESSTAGLPPTTDAGSGIPRQPTVRRAEGTPVQNQEVGEPLPGERVGHEVRGDRTIGNRTDFSTFVNEEGLVDEERSFNPLELDGDDPFEILARELEYISNANAQTGPFLAGRARAALKKAQAAIDNLEEDNRE